MNSILTEINTITDAVELLNQLRDPRVNKVYTLHDFNGCKTITQIENRYRTLRNAMYDEMDKFID